MAIAKAGALINPADAEDTIANAIVEDLSIGTAAANFTITEAVARTALGGRLVYVHLIMNTTNALTATSGNVADTPMFTLDAAYRPSEDISVGIGTGLVSGEALIADTGVVSIRAASDNIAAGANIRLHATFITA